MLFNNVNAIIAEKNSKRTTNYVQNADVLEFHYINLINYTSTQSPTLTLSISRTSPNLNTATKFM